LPVKKYDRHPHCETNLFRQYVCRHNGGGMEFNMKKKSVFSLTGSSLFIALGILLPMVFHAFGGGNALLPMHIPVLLCGFIFGWQYGAICGFIVPLLSALLTGMPPVFPVATAMMFELCAYGLLAGLFYKKFKWNVILALVAALLGGRVVSGLANALFMGIAGKTYGFSAFITGAFVTALPGIIIQIIAIPLIIVAIEKAGSRYLKKAG
jgi:thiamine transporter ThiT